MARLERRRNSCFSCIAHGVSPISEGVSLRLALTRVVINLTLVAERAAAAAADNRRRVVQLERKPLLAERQLAVYGKGRKLFKERDTTRRKKRKGLRAVLLLSANARSQRERKRRERERERGKK